MGDLVDVLEDGRLGIREEQVQMANFRLRRKEVKKKKSRMF